MYSGVLKTEEEIASACRYLDNNGLIQHIDWRKNWDVANVFRSLSLQPNHGPWLDMGGFGSPILHNAIVSGVKGFKASIDLQSVKTEQKDVAYVRGDLTKTPFPSDMFNTITCLSVLEHGVDFEAFALECSRLMRIGGKLFITFDYWDKPIETGCGRDWQILTPGRVQELIAHVTVRGGFDLHLEGEDYVKREVDMNVGEPVIEHCGCKYTFGMLSFTKFG